MITRLLRYFPVGDSRYAIAEAAKWKENYADAQQSKLRIQDHNNWLSAELERTRQERDRWAKEALECNKMLANVGWQGRNNWVPWPESGRLPQEYVDAEKPGPVSADNLRVQDQARRESADVMDKYFEKHPQFKRR